MGAVSDHAGRDYQLFASNWFVPLVAVFLRSVLEPALAYDLATETIAAARLQWDSAPVGDEAVDWLPAARLIPILSASALRTVRGAWRDRVHLADDFDALPDDIADALGSE